MIELTAAEASLRIKEGDLDAGEYFEFYRQRAAADALLAKPRICPRDGEVGGELAASSVWLGVPAPGWQQQLGGRCNEMNSSASLTASWRTGRPAHCRCGFRDDRCICRSG